MSNNDRKIIHTSLSESADVKRKMIESCGDDIIRAVDMIVTCFSRGNKLLLCGNGGSAADAQHIATEFVIRLSRELTRPALPALALTTDSSYLTAGSNDLGYENVFLRAVEALGKEHDILIAISTSGSSANIINAVQLANDRKLKTIGLLGGAGGKLLPICTHSIVIPSDDTQRIQEGHITAGHVICRLVEERMFASTAT
jgi:D-sedoheptulose 7-phosphate isomerase